MTGLLRVIFELIERANRRRQRVVATARTAQVGDETRGALHVANLTIAVAQARKNAGRLQTVLRAHPFKHMAELAEVSVHGQLGGTGHFPVTHGPIQLLLFIPRQEDVMRQRDGIVGDRSIDSVLEIQHARLRWIGHVDHQITGYIVTIHIRARLGRGAIDQQFEHLVERFALGGVKQVL